MQFLLENFNWIWLVAAMVSGGLLLRGLLQSGASGIPVAEAVRLMNKEKGIVIDVREAGEYATGRIAGSRHIPVGNLDASKDLPGNKALPLIVVCASGARATRAAKALQAKGHTSVHVLGGGLKAWREASMPVESGA